MEEKSTPRIYAASLADYNNGRLHGRWIDATQPAHAIEAEIHEMLASSCEAGAEEWAIHDSEGFGDVRLTEGMRVGTIKGITSRLQLDAPDRDERS